MRQSIIRALSSHNRALTNIDFFGIRDITSKDIAAAFANEAKLPNQSLEEKYEPLLTKRDKLDNEPKERNCVFGSVRRDDENVPKYHGQYEESGNKKLYDTVQIKQKFVPDRQDGLDDDQSISVSPHETDTNMSVSNPFANPAYKISEVESAEDLSNILNLFVSEKDASDKLSKYANVPPLIYFFNSGSEQPHQEPLSTGRGGSRPGKKPAFNEEISQGRPDAHSAEKTNNIKSPTNHYEPSIKRPQQILDKVAGPQGLEVPLHELNPLSEEFESRYNQYLAESKFDSVLDQKYDVKKPKKVEEQTQKTAIEHVKQIRERRVEPSSNILKKVLDKSERPYPLQPQMKLDSKGKCNYKYQVPDWFNSRRVDILDYFAKSIVYHNYDILAINKPYGLPSHGDSQDSYDVNSIVRDLAKSKFNINELYLAHRLDKNTTGVLLFATSKTRASSLQKQFRKDEIKKTYVALTRGLPDPEEGIVDVPIGEMFIAGKKRMCPAPEKFPEELQIANRYAEARRAVTEYKTIQVGKGNVSLLEIKPRTGVKHQIRCHLGFCLKTPILGDHKYTDIDRFVPQKLPIHALNALQLRQSKVRTLPIHLHAKTVVIPNAKANGEMLFITAPLPHHFSENLRALGLRL